jgi:hypothetical protein
MAKARDLLGKSGGGGFTPPPQTKKLDLTVHEDPEADKKSGPNKPHPDKAAQPKGGTKSSGGPPTSVRPKV